MARADHDRIEFHRSPGLGEALAYSDGLCGVQCGGDLHIFGKPAPKSSNYLEGSRPYYSLGQGVGAASMRIQILAGARHCRTGFRRARRRSRRRRSMGGRSPRRSKSCSTPITCFPEARPKFDAVLDQGHRGRPLRHFRSRPAGRAAQCRSPHGHARQASWRDVRPRNLEGACLAHPDAGADDAPPTPEDIAAAHAATAAWCRCASCPATSATSKPMASSGPARSPNAPMTMRCASFPAATR